MKGRQIRIYLVDGVPTGVLTAEIINWTGKVIVAPRSQLATLAKRDEVKRTGIYCLVGPDPDAPGKECVYVGEGDSVWSRLIKHDKDENKDFWNRVVFVISTPWTGAGRIYKLITEKISAKVAAVTMYQNTKSKARIEDDATPLRVMVSLLKVATELFKQFSDNEGFKRWLADTVFGLTFNEDAA